MSKIIALLFIGLGVFYWSKTQKLKQAAMYASRKRCKEAGVQFLDHSVVQRKISLAKDKLGRWGLQRVYYFEFTSTGEHRYQGTVTAHGHYIVDVELEAYSLN
ncbi:DUF3301 domain-containing protein [Aliikangiella sp. IMCC44653]